MSGETDQPKLGEASFPAKDFAEPTSSKGRNLACFGCLGAAVLLGLISVSFSYYAILYTSLPLKMVERLIESAPGVKIHELSGTLSSGFHIKEITYQSDSLDELSKIEDVEFRFNGIGNLFSEDRRLIIEEFSVASGTFYFRSKDDQTPEKKKANQNKEEHAEKSDESNRVKNTDDLFKEIRIDLVEFSKIKWINVDTQKTSQLKDAKMSDFHYLDGKVKEVGKYSIDGLTIELENFEMQNFCGNPADGFSIDRIRSKNDLDQWSDIQNIQFEFNGIDQMLNNKPVVIDRMGVDSGVFYITPSDWISNDTPDIDEIPDADWGEPIRQSVQIKEISLPNLKFINTDTGIEFSVKKLSFADLEWKDNLLVGLGKFVFEADQIQLSAGPSDRFQNQPNTALKRQFTGNLDAGVHPNLLQNVQFQLDACFLSADETLIEMELCDGQIKHASGKEKSVTTWRKFQRDAWLAELDFLTPAELNGQVVTTSKPEQTGERLRMQGTLKFGKVEFEVNVADIPITEDAKHIGPIPLVPSASPKELGAQLYLLDEFPFMVLKLQSKTEILDDKEAFAEALWGVAFADLNKQKQEQITKNLTAFDKLAPLEKGSPPDVKDDNE
ncbi:MAG: hypothetical protein P8J33_13600 [Pirellulaceae bacterium]|nr:hypothetical protein [Pirellulaceae bacterium]